MIEPKILIIALLAGILPAIIWLFFWLQEDQHPEPKRLLLLTFISGMIAVPLVLPIEQVIKTYFGFSQQLTFILWAWAEESLKFIAAYVVAFKSRELDEPVDAVIYLLTAALGFVALENTFFLLNPLSQGNILETVSTGNMRFLGASLLHIISSTTIGTFIALSFYKKRAIKVSYLFIGLVLAVLLHSVFNLLIIESTGSGIFPIFAGVWLAITVLLLLFEKVKKISPRKQ